MRLDQLPKSDKIEDRRGLPVGRAGLGIGTIIILILLGWIFGIDPRVLIGGAEMISGGNQTQQQQVDSSSDKGTPPDEMRRFVSAILGSTEAEWTEIFAHAGKTYSPPDFSHVLGGHTVCVRLRAGRNGTLLLPTRPEGLSRHQLL